MKYESLAIASAVRGRLAPNGSTIEVTGVRTDSRDVKLGDLFVPIVADRDGHDFIDAAISSGAVAWLTTRNDERLGAIRVEDTSVALTMLAANARARMDQWGTALIGVTGSSGKTSTKDLIRGVLAQKGPYGASEKSFNNEIGAPLTLLNSADRSWAVVVEMGARGIGHITSLCELARPTIGVVTNVGTAHLAMYDRPDGILIAKGELVEALPDAGTAVLNIGDASFVNHSSRTAARVLSFGLHGSGAEIVADSITFDDSLRASFALRTPWGSGTIRLSARGEHQILNALAAAGATLAAGASIAAVELGLATEALSPWRMEVGRTASGAVVINDAYNANDLSMTAALRSLARHPGRRRIAVLGTMAELGDHAPEAHRSMVELARKLEIDLVVAVDEPLYEGSDVVAKGIDGAKAALEDLQITEGDVILLKGSRVAGLERLAQSLGLVPQQVKKEAP